MPRKKPEGVSKIIIKSMLDTDAYKFSMQQVVFKKFPDIDAEFTFKNRTKDTPLKHSIYGDIIREEIDDLAKLRFKPLELKYLFGKGYYSEGYLELLRNFRFNPDYVRVYDVGKDILGIKINGNWLNTILFEVPVLSIVSEVRTSQLLESFGGYECVVEEGMKRLTHKLTKFNESCLELGNYIPYIDFGARRRLCYDWQNRVIRFLVEFTPKSFIGTSNEHFAMKHNILGAGTMAHEYIEGMQALVRLIDSQKYAFQTWADVYRGEMGIALSDTLGMDAFFKDFDLYFAKLFDGARHDSGDPYVWCNKLIEKYHSYKIDPYTKTAIFSDGLTFEKIVELYRTFGHKIKCSFGIGTNLMNDCGIKPLQIVIKMTKCDGKPVAKISDSPGKQMCESKPYLKYLTSVFDIPKEKIGVC